ncbi:MAG: 3-dehydroquinate synthase II [Thermoplasmatota archaeon]
MNGGRIPLWIDLRDVPVNKRLPYLKAARAVGVETIILGKDDPHLEREDMDVVWIDGRNTLKRGKEPIGRYVKLKGAKDQERAANVEGVVLVDSENWTIIPLENLIAARRDQPETLFGVARTPAQALLFRDTLEIGVHGIHLVPEEVSDIEEADRVLRLRGPRRNDAPSATLVSLVSNAREASQAKGKRKKTAAKKAPAKKKSSSEIIDMDEWEGHKAAAAVDAEPEPVASPQQPPADPAEEAPEDFLLAAELVSVADAGPGDRVCIDTTSLFRPGEGLLIGSTARSFALVHAETIESEYVRARPFRVNAGAVHSYLYAPDGKTRYLSELAAGTNVLAVHPDGVHRVVTVGRAKIERRPHTLLAWKTKDGREGNAVLQTAETIRLVTPKGDPVAVTDLQVGDKIMVHMESAARHFGMPVEEFLEEK